MYLRALDKFPELEDYFPHYDDKYIPPWEFFWGVLATLHPNVVKKLIKWSHEKWVVNEENQADEMIRIWDDFLEQLEQTAFESSKWSLIVREEK